MSRAASPVGPRSHAANDNAYIEPYCIEVQRSCGAWHLLVRVDGHECYMTPDYADAVAAGLKGCVQSRLVIDALQYSAYRCRMFDAGMPA